MDNSLELKKLKRQMVELLVSMELDKLVHETSVSTIKSFGDVKYVTPDTDKWARKIISIVKEHSL